MKSHKICALWNEDEVIGFLVTEKCTHTMYEKNPLTGFQSLMVKLSILHTFMVCKDKF